MAGMANSNKSLSLIDYTKKALDIALHPGKVNESYNNIGDALTFYYKAAIIPAIAAAVLGFILLFAVGSLGLGLFASILGGFAALGGIIFGLVGAIFILAYILVLVPISIVINAAIYQLFAKRIFKIWNKPLPKTLTAVMFAAFPVMLLFWTIFIPIAGEIILIAAGIWSFIILIISMARQQQVSGWRAFGGILVSGIILSVIVAAIELPILFVVGPSVTPALASACIPSTGFICSNFVYAHNAISAEIGQTTGATMYKAEVFFVGSGSNFSTADPSFYIGTLNTDGTVHMSISNVAIGYNKTSGLYGGNLVLEYYSSISQTTPYVKDIATVLVNK